MNYIGFVHSELGSVSGGNRDSFMELTSMFSKHPEVVNNDL